MSIHDRGHKMTSPSVHSRLTEIAMLQTSKQCIRGDRRCDACRGMGHKDWSYAGYHLRLKYCAATTRVAVKAWDVRLQQLFPCDALEK